LCINCILQRGTEEEHEECLDNAFH
jgi:hypothetical protein